MQQSIKNYLILLFILGALPAFAQHTLKYEDVELDIETGMILRYESSHEDIIIPAFLMIKGEKVAVKGIWGYAFNFSDHGDSAPIKSVVIPNSVISIGDRAFENNSLQSVTIPNSVKIIGDYAFSDNSLQNVTIPNSVISIGQSAFSNNNLNSVTIGNSVSVIGASAFDGNPDLSEIILPDQVIKNGYTFESWENENGMGIEKITDKSTFYVVRFDKPITLTIDDVIFDERTGTIFNLYSPYRDFIIPTSFKVKDKEVALKHIGYGAFSNIGITKVTIPNGVQIIGNNAFINNKLTVISIPGSVLSIGSKAFSENNLRKITISEGVKSISRNAFAQNKLTSVTTPNSLVSIGNQAFHDNNISSLTLGNSITGIGHMAFSYNELTDVILPNSLTFIGSEAFSNNANLSEIELPNSVNKQGYTFEGWKDDSGMNQERIIDLNNSYQVQFDKHITLTLNDIEFDASTGTILNYLSAYREIIIPSSFEVNGQEVEVKKIGNAAFSTKFITSVEIPNSVVTIGPRAFEYNPLTEITIPNGVTQIHNGAFYDNRLVEVNLPNSLTKLEWNVFSRNQLTNVTIPDGVTAIGYGAFSSNLITHVTLPNSVDLIDINAFYNNEGLGDIPLPNTVDKEGYTFQHWENGDGEIATSITDKTKYYQARFDKPITLTIDDLDLPIEYSDQYPPGYIVNYSSAYKEFIIPNYVEFEGKRINITHIGYSAFDQKSITHVTIPKSVTNIEQHAFSYNNLKQVTFEKGSQLNCIDKGAFFANIDLEDIVLPDPVVKEGHTFVRWVDNNGNPLKILQNHEMLYFAEFTINSYTISGQISGVSEAKITSTVGEDEQEVTPDSDGKYSITVNHGDDVTITPSKIGYSFKPENRKLNDVRADRSRQDFAATLNTYTLSGSVTGAPAVDITLLVDGQEQTTTTDDIGKYSFTVEHGDDVTITPSKIGYSFKPENRRLNDVGADRSRQDFAATLNTYTLSGSVTGAPAVDITLLVDGQEQITTTDDNGKYSFTVKHGDDVTITPTKTGYAFSPESIPLNNVQEDKTDNDFVARVFSGIENEEVSTMYVYPNPAQNQLTIEIPEGHELLQLMDATGRVLAHIPCKGQPSVTIDMGDKNQGVYFIKLTGEDNTRFHRIVKY